MNLPGTTNFDIQSLQMTQAGIFQVGTFQIGTFQVIQNMAICKDYIPNLLRLYPLLILNWSRLLR